MIISGKKYVVTLDEPMMMADGLIYDCVYGTVYLHDYGETFPFPVKGHANYFFTIGGEELLNGVVIVGGCRVRKAVQVDDPPPVYYVKTNVYESPTGKVEDLRPTEYYQFNYFNADLFLKLQKDEEL